MKKNCYLSDKKICIKSEKKDINVKKNWEIKMVKSKWRSKIRKNNDFYWISRWWWKRKHLKKARWSRNIMWGKRRGAPKLKKWWRYHSKVHMAKIKPNGWPLLNSYDAKKFIHISGFWELLFYPYAAKTSSSYIKIKNRLSKD